MRRTASSRWIDFVLGGILFMGGWTLIMSLIGWPLGIPMFAAGLALLMDNPK